MDGLVRGEFEYRALQGNAVINHCDAVVPWTRMIEHKHFNPQADDPDCSVLTKETPMAWSRDETPYYSFNNDAKGMAPLTHVRWVPFIGQIWPLTSLTPGGRNRVQSQCRPHGEFCLPGSCGALHGSTSIGSGRG